MKLLNFFMPWTTTRADPRLQITREERKMHRMQNNSAEQNGEPNTAKKTGSNQSAMESPTPIPAWKKFQQRYHALNNPTIFPTLSDYEDLFTLLDKSLPDEEKRQTLYKAFKEDPIKLFVCISLPLQYRDIPSVATTSSYRVMEYIFSDPKAWKEITALFLNHEANIGHFYVQKLLLPMVEKALSIDWNLPENNDLIDHLLPHKSFSEIPKSKRFNIKRMLATNALMEAIVHMGGTSLATEKPSVIRYPQIVLAILKKINVFFEKDPEYRLDKSTESYTLLQTESELDNAFNLMSTHYVWDYLLDCCAENYLRPDVDHYNGVQRLYYIPDSKGETPKQDWRAKWEEHNANYRQACSEALEEALRQKIALEEAREAIIDKHPWILESGEVTQSLPLQEALALAKQVVEVCERVHVPNNRPWANRGIPIGHQLAQFLKNSLPDDSLLSLISYDEENFVHSAARRGGDAIDIIEAIANTPKLHALLRECCGAGKESPLAVALKAGNKSVISSQSKILIELLGEYTPLSRWHELLKEEYRGSYTTIKEIKDCIEKDYTVVQEVGYRLLNSKYDRVDSILWGIVTNQLSNVRLPNKYIGNILKGEGWGSKEDIIYVKKEEVSPEIVKDVVADHLAYFLYLLRYAKTNDAYQLGSGTILRYLSEIYIENPSIIKQEAVIQADTKAIEELEASANRRPRLR